MSETLRLGLPDASGHFGPYGGKFVPEDKIEPTDGIFNCADGNVAKLTGDYGTGAKCPNPAYATDPKPSNCS